MGEEHPLLESFGFGIFMSIISVLLLADYTRLFWTTGDLARFGFGVLAWLVMSVVWIVVSVIRGRARAPVK